MQHEMNTMVHPTDQVSQIKKNLLKSYALSNIKLNQWMLLTLPQQLLNDENKLMSRNQIKRAYRYSYQYLLLKVKLISQYEEGH